MGGFQKILEKYHLEKWFQKENLIVLILAGILLIVIALPTKDSSAQNDNAGYVYEENQRSLWGTVDNSSSKGAGTENADGRSDTAGSDVGGAQTVDYVTGLEEKLAKILSQIQGVGKVYVMITLQESEELIVEKDRVDTQEETVYETEGNSSVPYVIKTILPKVEGVAVIAEGAGSGTVTKTITEIVQALFDLEIHKIKVVGG